MNGIPFDLFALESALIDFGELLALVFGAIVAIVLGLMWITRNWNNRHR